MIMSMTGFGWAERNNKFFSIEINIRSTNNRFFDFNIKLPNAISSLEKIIYDSCKKNFKRGSIQLYCKIKMNQDESKKSKVDKNKLNDFYKLLLPISKKFSDEKISLNLSFDSMLSKLISNDFSSFVPKLTEKSKIIASKDLR